ncbi:MAG TPA: hypothetical protein VHF67_11085 [Gaiellaceae bacterium]|nr:hypothetical protein [Gaiellaceae bacterium]
MAGPVGDVADERLVTPRQLDDAPGELEVLDLLARARVVDLARAPLA